MNVTFNNTKFNLNASRHIKHPVFGQLEDNIIYTFSGKSAISILLRYFRNTGKLQNKTDQVLVPHWMGNWVYMTMHKLCFPSTVYNPKVKGVFAYHQWGFPQDMEKILAFCAENNLFCIEDCAHAFKSYYKGKRVGTYGNAAVFSLAKFFPCGVSGAIYTEDPKIKDFAKDVLKEHNPSLARKAFRHRIVTDSAPSQANQIELGRYYAIYDKMLKCSNYSLAVVRQQLMEGALQKRQDNYKLFLDEFAKYDSVETLANDNNAPWVFPLFLNEKLRSKINAALTINNIESGIYHFDINRNMLNPNFKKCIVLPCHQGISENAISHIIKIVKKIVKTT